MSTMVVAQKPTPKFNNPPPGVCTKDTVATEGQNKFVCNGGKWEWWATIPNLHARTICMDGEQATEDGNHFVCATGGWKSTDPVKTITKRTVCTDGKMQKVAGELYVCHFDHWDSMLAGGSGTVKMVTIKSPDAPVFAAITTVPIPEMDVPAVTYTADTGYISVDTLTNKLISIAETRYKCADSARVLLTSEDGVKHCILFPSQSVLPINEGGLVKGYGKITCNGAILSNPTRCSVTGK